MFLAVLAPGGAFVGQGAYRVARVDRDTVWHYVAGRRIYELQDPEGRRYVMQSFSRIVDSELQLADLASLGDRLDLPAGWQFTTRILREPLAVPVADGVAEVVQDDLVPRELRERLAQDLAVRVAAFAGRHELPGPAARDLFVAGLARAPEEARVATERDWDAFVRWVEGLDDRFFEGRMRACLLAGLHRARL